MAAHELNNTILKNSSALKAYYRFESTVNDELATSNGTATDITYAAGVYGNAAVFNGTTGAVSVTNTTSVQDLFAGDGSISCWIYPSSLGEGNLGRIVDKTGSTTAGYFFHMFGGTGPYQIGFSHYFSTNYFSCHTTTASLVKDSWNHVVIIYNGSNTSNVSRIYVNGKYEAITVDATPTGSRTSDGTAALVIGNRSDGARAFDGMIDDLAIFSTALSADQIKELYEGRFIGEAWPQSGLVAGYHLNGSSTDFSGNNYHLTDTAVTYSQANGKFGQGGSYNGSSSKSLLNSALGITGNISLSLWIQQNAEIGSGVQTYICTYNKTNGRQYSIGYEYNSGTRRLVFSADTVDAAVVNTTFNITLGTTNWYHAVLTYDGSTLKAYLNGNLVNSTASTGNGSLSYNACFRIGCRTNVGSLGDSEFANAKLDEVLIFNRALTASEIRKMYAVGTGRFT